MKPASAARPAPAVALARSPGDGLDPARRAALVRALWGLLAGGAAGLAAPRVRAAEASLSDAVRTSSEALFAAPLVDLAGQPARLAPRPGRGLIVNFWARWCGPCKVEIPELVALQSRQRGVEVVGIALENDPAAVRDFARAYEINYPVLLAREGGPDLMRALGNSKTGLPFTLVLDRQGTPVAQQLGALTRAQLDLAAERALR